LKGSRGAGVSTSKGVNTTVRLEHSNTISTKISINGCQTNSASVSEYVAKSMVAQAGRNYKVSIEHRVDVPIGVGLGTSGAGALSLAVSLNEALGLNLSIEEAAQVAHIAEVECKTGLGTVIAETYGGMEIRLKAGAPGIGEMKKIPLGNDYVVAFLPFGAISTSSILTNQVFRRRINDLGGSYVTHLLKSPNPDRFMKLSRYFAEYVGLITDRVRTVLDETDKVGIRCSMPMFGEAVFALTKREDADHLLNVFKKHEVPIPAISEISGEMSGTILAEVDEKGVRLV